MKSKDQRTPKRRCVSCMESFPQKDLIRLTLNGKDLIIDHTGNAPGRGMYICRNEECIDKIIKKKAFNRACKCWLETAMLESLQSELLTVLKEETNVKES